MRFLVTVEQKYMVPSEVQLGLLEGSLAWAKKTVSAMIKK